MEAGMAGIKGRRIPEDVLQTVREAVLLGRSYEEIISATGVSTNIIAEEKRQMGLIPGRGRGGKARSKRWTRTPQAIVDAAREMVLAEESYRAISSATGAPRSTITKLKVELGLVTRQAPRSEQQPPQAPAQDAAPTAPHPSGAYFQAIRDGILEGFAREQALEKHVAILQSRIADLEAKNRELHDAVTQIRAKLSSWAGPAPIPHRNLSTGG
jgi:uncharacterized protein YerC